MEFGYLEPQEALEKRIDAFFVRLKSRQENNIAIIGHSDAFHCLLERHFGMEKWMGNCEVVSVEIESSHVKL